MKKWMKHVNFEYEDLKPKTSEEVVKELKKEFWHISTFDIANFDFYHIGNAFFIVQYQEYEIHEGYGYACIYLMKFEEVVKLRKFINKES